MLRIPSRLPADLEELASRAIGCAVRVHWELGPGLLESIYVKAMCIELEAERLPFERERRISVTYRGRPLHEHRLDLVVDDRVIVEAKSIERLAAIHHAQILSYLRISGLRLGLLINFNVPILPHGLRRVVL